ncbi:ABC transporter ATP-binding protein [Corynebacterium sp. HMSC074A01]|uniref:ABC transporter ATP-binding protein n=1 Tax=Corynebacterium sp. HMSC074A01 TaxID=1715030 RepID=UPI0008A1B35D|nr:ABC transporter ATP-binding protein [Corynebacterium sp. HMSC074A01]OHF39872.1 multidrug ABC transporter ATP-binding protein [Corynebacterium sp. HMSC074A01]
MENVIEVQNLQRRYGEFTAVDGISLHVARGEAYGLLGTNGAGKTSTLEILEGLAAPTAGEVRVLGMDPVADRASVRPHTGIMLQSGGLPRALSVEETLTMWAGTCTAPLPIDDVLADVQLTHRRDVKVGALSGGEQRRLDLACALLGSPDVIFLDEPTTGLDPESRRRVWELLRELKSRGVTIVLTTHYLEEAEFLCDRIAIMHGGRIEVEGTTTELARTVPSSIEFVLPSAQVPELPTLPGSLVHSNETAEGMQVAVHTSRLQDDAFAILAWAREHNLELTQFAAQPASLERVFHDIAEAQNTHTTRKDEAA